MRNLRNNWLRIATHIAAFAPFALLMWDFFQDRLTVNPIQEITFRTGKTALVLLILCLACTPINTTLNYKPVTALRRPLGLWAFFYATLHFLTFVWLDYGLDLGLILETIREKRYVLAGFAAFLLLIPLAVTSTRGWQRRLGKRWKPLHRLVYLAAPLVIVHYIWLVKADIREPLFYGAIVALLLAARVPRVRRAIVRMRGRAVARGPKAAFRVPSLRQAPDDRQAAEDRRPQL